MIKLIVIEIKVNYKQNSKQIEFKRLVVFKFIVVIFSMDLNEIHGRHRTNNHTRYHQQ